MDSVKTQISLRIHEVGLVSMPSTYINEVLFKINFDIVTIATNYYCHHHCYFYCYNNYFYHYSNYYNSCFCCCYYYSCCCHWLCLLLLLLIIIIITLKYMKPINVICQKKDVKMLISRVSVQSDQSSPCTHSMDFAVSWPGPMAL